MVLSPESTEDEVTAIIERVDGLISGGGGTPGEHEVWGTKRLAYPLQRFMEGNYVMTRFSLGPAAVLELDRELKSSEDILRFLVTKV